MIKLSTRQKTDIPHWFFFFLSSEPPAGWIWHFECHRWKFTVWTELLASLNFSPLGGLNNVTAQRFSVSVGAKNWRSTFLVLRRNQSHFNSDTHRTGTSRFFWNHSRSWVRFVDDWHWDVSSFAFQSPVEVICKDSAYLTECSAGENCFEHEIMHSLLDLL